MRGGVARQVWLVGTAVVTLGAFAVAILLAPRASGQPGIALESLLFLGSSAHVASTAWFATVPEVRAYARTRPVRYVFVPAGLIVSAAVLAAALPPQAVRWATLGFFGWQFWHFQKQNLGLSALAAAACGAERPGRGERRALVGAGAFGIAGLLAHPELLQVTVDPRLRFLFPVAAVGYAACVVAGVVLWLRRGSRDARFSVIHLSALGFFMPVFLFSSPYAAVAGLTMAHGFQYLLIMALVAGSPSVPAGRLFDTPGQAAAVRVVVLVNLAVIFGAVLTRTSHLHDSAAPVRALYGAYLGAVMAHFVVDAGLWRLRDEFPRRFLGTRLPYLLAAR